MTSSMERFEKIVYGEIAEDDQSTRAAWQEFVMKWSKDRKEKNHLAELARRQYSLGDDGITYSSALTVTYIARAVRKLLRSESGMTVLQSNNHRGKQ